MAVIVVATRDADLYARLVEFPYDIKPFTSAYILAHHLKSHTPNLIILDAELPGLSTFSLCERLRKVKRLKRIPVLILTSQPGPRDITDAQMSGATALLEKPLNDDILKPFLPRLSAAEKKAAQEKAEREKAVQEKMAREKAKQLRQPIEQKAETAKVQLIIGEVGEGADPVLSGKATFDRLFQLLAMLQQWGETGRLRLKLSEGEAVVLLSVGEPIHAVLGIRTGERAVRRMFEIVQNTPAAFVFEATKVPKTSRTIHTSMDVLLLEVAVTLDTPEPEAKS